MTTAGGAESADPALLRLGRALQGAGHRFVTVTPATHARVNARAGNEWARSVADVFGWSRPFRLDLLPPSLVDLMEAASVLQRQDGGACRSTLRASTLGGSLYFHSAYPTTASDAVFFGPDTYRFATAISQHLAKSGGDVRRAVDVGCGAGPGAVVVGLARPAAEVIGVDINPAALRLTRVNAVLAGADNVRAMQSDLLESVDGEFDLIVANPPYLLDPGERAYRHGGGGMGEGLSLAIVDLAKTRLAAGGTLLLYTGSAICQGVDRFRALAESRLQGSGLDWTYSEIDPDVFGEELLEPAYAVADRIAAVLLTVRTGH